ncbi:putative lipoprotein transmembrane [Aurantiacibacter gangjinensis]|nr:putative lipoprotein transmembrane [Aurantiacibacter gangjinensis]
MKTFSLKRSAKFATLPLLAMGLAACATPFRADVSRFEAQLPAPQGQSFYVVADDPALAGGLEFSLYADHVEDEMEDLGYVQAASPEDATLLVRFDYGVDDGRERIRTTGAGFGAYDPFWGSWGTFRRPVAFRDRRGRTRIAYVPTRRWGYGWHDPFFHRGADVRSYTVYTSGIDLKIDDAASGERLFEGSAQAASRSDRLQYLVPNLVEAMFTDFPGNSGETVRISIAEEDQPVRRDER